MKALSRRRISGGLGLVCAMGFILFARLTDRPIGCLWKKILHIPCPGCGLTRSVALAWQMHFAEAAKMNILFVPLLLGFGVYLCCLILDIFTERQTVQAYYRVLGSKPAILLAVALTLGSWTYNFIRGI